MRNKKTIGKATASVDWWCGHLFLLVLCIALVQGFALIMWRHWQVISTAVAGANRGWQAEQIFEIALTFITCGIIIMLFYWYGNHLIKKMLNPS
jgi:heme/copper-type cytochrome/quinol oxidase subunit 2